MGNNIVHFEINVYDVERAKRFYSILLGWAFKHDEKMDYTLVYPGGKVMDGPATMGINGGMMKWSDPKPAEGTAPNAFVCTVTVDDIDKVLAMVEPNGGKISTPANEIPGVGRFAYIRDTEMNLLGILQPSPGSMM
jgi:predicted enzyme related to lactoylglutathione lyase